MNPQIQTIDHYIIQVDENPPMLVKNTSFLLPNNQDQQTIHLRAVDGCGRKGEMLSFLYVPSVATTTDTHTTVYVSSTAPTKFNDMVQTVAETGAEPSGAIAAIQADLRYQLTAMFLFLCLLT